MSHRPRVVKPRNRQYRRHPVVAVFRNETLDESGELGSVNDLLAALPQKPPTLFVAPAAADLIAQWGVGFSARYGDTWQWRASTHERNIVRPDGKLIAARVSVVIHFFGWKGGNYHKIIDPVTMYGHSLNDIWPGDDDTLVKLLRWGVQIRDFCDENGIDVRPTIGGISSQLLTDRRFYPEPRRKVPAATNAATREYMTGNYYYLNVKPEREANLTAHYIDQTRAHHYHARTTALPDSNLLYAYGRFVDLAKVCWDHPFDEFYGLYCADLSYQRKGTRQFGWIRGFQRELTKQFVWSNELPHLADMGFTVTGVRAAWGSRKRDTGLARYATWAESQLDRYENAPWLKPLLLSAYGILATRPRHAETVFRLARKGEPVTVVTGHNSLSGVHIKGRMKLEPRIANVLHRGMIEAATRSESVGLAQHLAGQGHKILSIYADAVIVQVDEERPLPSLPEPWRLKDTLNHLQFINQQAFISGEMTKLPGVAGELRQITSRSPRPSLPVINVAAEMEHEEYINSLITKNRKLHHGNAESSHARAHRQTV